MRLNPMDYWVAHLIRSLHPYMGLRSILRYRQFRNRVAHGNAVPGRVFRLRIKVPKAGYLYLREGWPDIDSFSEVFVYDVYRLVLDHVSECKRIIDLGANIGLASLYFAVHYPQAVTVSVEPHPANYEMLVKNLHGLLAAGKCRTLRAAVWSEETSLVADPTKPSDQYNAFAVCKSAKELESPFRIDGVTVPKILRECGWDQVDLLKIDIEGAETELFRGKLDWLARVRALAIEFHGNARKICDFDGVARRYGFKNFDENQHTVVAVR